MVVSQNEGFKVSQNMKIVVSNGEAATCSQPFTFEYAPRCNNAQVVSWIDQSANDFVYYPQDTGATAPLYYKGLTEIGFQNNFPNACNIRGK